MKIALKAPKITAAQRKDLEAHKSNLEETIRDAESRNQKAAELRQKEESQRKKAEALHERAAAFELAAETDLASTLKQIERISGATRELESSAHDEKAVDFQIIDLAQEEVSRICQKTYNDLLDQIGEVLSPYFLSFHDARYVARGAPAVNALVRQLLTHGGAAQYSVEGLYAAAKDTLRKVNALLDGGEIWSFDSAAQ